MKNKKPSLPNKIIRRNKSYSIEDCALYKLKSLKQLEDRLLTSREQLETLANDSNFNIFTLKKGSKARPIQAPNYELSLIHSRIASLIARISPPDFLHSGVPQRSNITNARVHLGNHSVLTLDIQSFFPSITQSRIYRFFKNELKMASDLSGILANLICYQGKLPTGSRLSMLLAFWVNYRLFMDISDYCKENGINFSLYVDDLTLSGNLKGDTLKVIKSLINKSGYKVHPRKTKRYGPNDHKLITGVIVYQNHMKVRNKHLKSIHEDILRLGETNSITEYEKLYRKVIGKLGAAGQIMDNFKQKAQSLKVNSLR